MGPSAMLDGGTAMAAMEKFFDVGPPEMAKQFLVRGVAS